MPEQKYGSSKGKSAREREQYYNEEVKRLIQFAYENTPAMKERLDQAGVKPSQIRTTKDLEHIPFITRDEIIELQKANPPFGGLLAVPVESLYKLLFSPGPIYVPIGSPEYARPTLNMLYAGGLQEGNLVICSLPSLFAAGSVAIDAMALGKMVAIPAGAGNTELQVNMIRDLGIKGYFGSPSFLLNLVHKADELGYNFRREFKLRNAVVIAEPLLPEVRKTLEEDYGIRVTDSIGVGIGPALGVECTQKAGFHMLEETFVEIVNLETGKQLGPGEIGVIVVTSFSNDAFPVVRYMTGDLSMFTEEPCTCGQTSIRLMGVMGRVGDSVKIRALYLTPGQLKIIASRFPAIAKYQVLVSREGHRDELTFNIELADDTIDRGEFSRELKNSFQDACRLRIDKLNFVPKGAIPEDHKTIVDERSWQVRR